MLRVGPWLTAVLATMAPASGGASPKARVELELGAGAEISLSRPDFGRGSHRNHPALARAELPRHGADDRSSLAEDVTSRLIPGRPDLAVRDMVPVVVSQPAPLVLTPPPAQVPTWLPPYGFPMLGAFQYPQPTWLPLTVTEQPAGAKAVPPEPEMGSLSDEEIWRRRQHSLADEDSAAEEDEDKDDDEQVDEEVQKGEKKRPEEGRGKGWEHASSKAKALEEGSGSDGPQSWRGPDAGRELVEDDGVDVEDAEKTFAASGNGLTPSLQDGASPGELPIGCFNPGMSWEKMESDDVTMDSTTALGRSAAHDEEVLVWHKRNCKAKCHQINHHAEDMFYFYAVRCGKAEPSCWCIRHPWDPNSDAGRLSADPTAPYACVDNIIRQEQGIRVCESAGAAAFALSRRQALAQAAMLTQVRQAELPLPSTGQVRAGGRDVQVVRNSGQLDRRSQDLQARSLFRKRGSLERG